MFLASSTAYELTRAFALLFSFKQADRGIPRSSHLSTSIMAFFNLLWQIITLAVMNILEQMLNAADWIMFTIEEFEVYGNIVKVRSFKNVPGQILRSD